MTDKILKPAAEQKENIRRIEIKEIVLKNPII